MWMIKATLRNLVEEIEVSTEKKEIKTLFVEFNKLIWSITGIFLLVYFVTK